MIDSQHFHLAAGPSRKETVDRLLALLPRLPVDKAWSVEVKLARPKRTDAQNRYLWGVCYPEILKQGGETLGGFEKDDLHEYLLGEHTGWETVTAFGRRRQRPIKRSSRMTKMEFVDFVDFIKRRMAEHGIVIPDAGEIGDD